jgi:hypothetical protein
VKRQEERDERQERQEEVDVGNEFVLYPVKRVFKRIVFYDR